MIACFLFLGDILCDNSGLPAKKCRMSDRSESGAVWREKAINLLSMDFWLYRYFTFIMILENILPENHSLEYFLTWSMTKNDLHVIFGHNWKRICLNRGHQQYNILMWTGSDFSPLCIFKCIQRAICCREGSVGQASVNRVCHLCKEKRVFPH